MGLMLWMLVIKVEHVFNLSTTNCHSEFAHPDTLCLSRQPSKPCHPGVLLLLLLSRWHPVLPLAPFFLLLLLRSVQFVVEIHINCISRAKGPYLYYYYSSLAFVVVGR